MRYGGVRDPASHMFSSRLSFELAPNRLSAALRRLRDAGVEIDDLTESNPTRVGLTYPPRLLDALSSPSALSYGPQPFGLPVARQAVVDDFRRRGFHVTRDRVVLTASTSEAYSLLFKLLCDPEDDVLVPVPSYPLFEYLAGLDCVRVRPYRLDGDGGWSYDVDAIKRAATPRTRAVVVVSPNNPTGSYLKRYDLPALAAFCRAQGLAIIGDEVFAEYVLDAELPRTCSVLAQREALTFGLGGLSKAVGLPQLKLGWIVVGGPDDLVKPALERLELICDTYLSVATPVQEALPVLLAEGAAVRTQIRDRVRRNYGALVEAAARHPSVNVAPAEGGWYAVLRVPAVQPEEAIVLRLLEQEHVLVHPGYFFDFPREACLVLSLLPSPEVFDRAVGRLLARVEAAE
jgi:alanine-synthesizing transaminase